MNGYMLQVVGTVVARYPSTGRIVLDVANNGRVRVMVPEAIWSSAVAFKPGARVTVDGMYAGSGGYGAKMSAWVEAWAIREFGAKKRSRRAS